MKSMGKASSFSQLSLIYITTIVLERFILVLLFLRSFWFINSFLLVNQLLEWSSFWSATGFERFFLTFWFFQHLFWFRFGEVGIKECLNIGAKNMLCRVASLKRFLRGWLNSFCPFLRRRTLSILKLFILPINDFALRTNEHIGRLNDNFSIRITIIFLIFAWVMRANIGVGRGNSILFTTYGALVSLTGLNRSFPSSFLLC